MDKYILLFLIALVSVFSKNKVLLLAAVTVFILSLLPYSNKSLALIRSKGMTFGIYALTVAILAPIAVGEVGIKDLFKILRSYQGLVAITLGAVVSILSTKGIGLQLQSPQIVVSVTLGTVIGIAFLGGTATGPIIASGMTYALIKLIERFI